MKPPQNALINIEADENRQKVIEQDDVVRVNNLLGVVDDTDEMILSEQDIQKMSWLVPEGVPLALATDELSALIEALRALPEAAPVDSIVWNAVSSPSDVDHLMKSVMIYQSFNVQAVAISEKIGANDDFRRFVKTSKHPPETELRKVLAGEQRQIDKISGFSVALSSFIEDMECVFDKRPWTIGSILVLTAATAGLKQLKYASKNGWKFENSLDEDFLREVETFRAEMSFYSKRIADVYGVNLLKHSITSLSGLKRGVFEAGADLHSALMVFGINEQNEDKFVALAANVQELFVSYDKLCVAFEKHGFSETSMSEVMTLIRFRRYLMAAAEKIGVEWSNLWDLMCPRKMVSGEQFSEFISKLQSDTFSAKLASISQDKNQYIDKVLSAADQYVFMRQYWVDAGHRVIGADPEIRFMDIKAILEMEPEIVASTEKLATVGVMDRKDVDQLEKHLEWMIGVYALPISNFAISNIIETRGEVIKNMLTDERKVLEYQTA